METLMRLLYEVSTATLNAYIRFWRRRDLTWKGQALKWANKARQGSQGAHDDRARLKAANLLLALSKNEALKPDQRWALTVAWRAVNRDYGPASADFVAREIAEGKGRA